MKKFIMSKMMSLMDLKRMTEVKEQYIIKETSKEEN